MTSVWFFIGDFFQSILPAIKAVGRLGNFFFFFVGFIANAVWIGYMIKDKEPDKGKYYTRF